MVSRVSKHLPQDFNVGSVLDSWHADKIATQSSHEIQKNWDRALDYAEELKEILEEHKDKPLELADALKSQLNITLKPHEYNNAEASILRQQGFPASTLDELIDVIHAQQELTEQFDSWIPFMDDAQDMMEFMLDNRDRLDPEVLNMSFAEFVKSGQAAEFVNNIDSRPRSVSISAAEMTATWKANEKNLASSFSLNTDVENIRNGVYDDVPAHLQYANEIYNSSEQKVSAFAPLIDAQNKLAAEHFDGDKVAMAQFFIENPPSKPPVSEMDFTEFVTSGQAALFIELTNEGLSLSKTYNTTSGQAKTTEAAQRAQQSNTLKHKPPEEAQTFALEERKPLVVVDITEKQAGQVAAKASNTQNQAVDQSGQAASSTQTTTTTTTSRDTSSDTFHTVESGDALSVIVQNKYDTDSANPMSWPEIKAMTEIIAKISGIQKINEIDPGDKITLPSQEQMDAIAAGDIDIKTASPVIAVDSKVIPPS